MNNVKKNICSLIKIDFNCHHHCQLDRIVYRVIDKINKWRVNTINSFN